METNIERNNVRNVYNSIAQHFTVTRSYIWNWIEEFLLSYNKNHHILDIGCGSGRNMELTQSQAKFTGIDNCLEFVKICTSKSLHVIEANMIDLPFESGSFDAIISIASFHHLSNEEHRLLCLQEMKRVIKPGGKILLSVWSINQPIKIKRSFTYGDNMVSWKKFDIHTKSNIVFERYYYIFKIEELHDIFLKVGLKIYHYEWNMGNEVFILELV